MNKPAPKEPSMDEILSSIRQIIADDDAAVAPRSGAPSQSAAPAARPFPSFPAAARTQTPPAAGVIPRSGGVPEQLRAEPARPEPPRSEPQRAEPPRAEPAGAEPPRMQPRPEPLALSPEQILGEEDEADEEPVTSLSFADILAGNSEPEHHVATFAQPPELIDPEDVTFEPESEPKVMPSFPVAAEPVPPSRPQQPMAFQPTPGRRPAPQPQQPSRPAPSVAQAAPMPDPTLSEELAEQLLEPTTSSAVKHAFSRLSGLSTVSAGVTIEEMMRDMLRPMLKEWLDENLPTIVERMVEKEIARISRGVE